jgi:hypothetical protein
MIVADARALGGPRSDPVEFAPESRPRRRLRWMFQALLGVVVLLAGFNYAINPYGAWRLHLISPIFRYSNRQRLVVPYLIRVAQPQTVLFGDSRTALGFPIPQYERDQVLNAGLFGGRISEIIELIDAALKNPRLKLIVWQVDFVLFNASQENVVDPLTMGRLKEPYHHIVGDTLLSLDALDDSQAMFARARRGEVELGPAWRAAVPWPPDLIRAGDDSRSQYLGSQLETTKFLATYATHLYSPYQPSERQFDALRASVEKVRRAGVAIILFSPPVHLAELEMLRQSGAWDDFMRWKREMAGVQPYLDFSGYNEIARADSMYIDPLHFGASIGYAIMRRVMNLDCSRCGLAGALVASSQTRWDPASADVNRAAQTRAMQIATQAPSFYSKAAAAARLDLAARNRTGANF